MIFKCKHCRFQTTTQRELDLHVNKYHPYSRHDPVQPASGNISPSSYDMPSYTPSSDSYSSDTTSSSDDSYSGGGGDFGGGGASGDY